MQVGEAVPRQTFELDLRLLLATELGVSHRQAGPDARNIRRLLRARSHKRLQFIEPPLGPAQSHQLNKATLNEQRVLGALTQGEGLPTQTLRLLEAAFQQSPHRPNEHRETDERG